MDDIVELHLRASTPTLTDSSTWKTVVLQLLRLISEAGRDGESKETGTLRTRLSQHRQVLGGVLHPQEERHEAADCVATCEEFLRRVQLDSRARETELTDLVTLLRDAAAKMIGDSSDFHAEILSSAGRFKTMVRLDEIRELLRLVDERDQPCAEARAVAAAHLDDVRAKIADLKRMERVLKDVVAQCADGTRQECPLIEALFAGHA